MLLQGVLPPYQDFQATEDFSHAGAGIPQPPSHGLTLPAALHGRPPSWLTTRCCPLQRPCIFPAPLLVLQQLPHIPTAQRGRPPAEVLGVLQGSVGLLEPDDFWSLAVTGPL